LVYSWTSYDPGQCQPSTQEEGPIPEEDEARVVLEVGQFLKKKSMGKYLQKAKPMI